LDATPATSHRVYYKGEVVGFPKGGEDVGFPTKGEVVGFPKGGKMLASPPRE